MTFRLTTLLYLFAIVASSIAVMGPWGLLLGGWIFFAWAWVSRPLRYPSPSAKLWGMFKLFVCPLILVALFIPATRPADEPYGTARNNLRNLALALQAYHRDHGCYPPPFVADATGEPLYSWRVLLLPYIEQPQLAEQFHYDEPWDSPHNLKLLPALSAFRSTTPNVPGETHYLAVVGAGTVWEPGHKVSHDDITDDKGETLLLVEVRSRGVLWSEPCDLSLDEAVELLQKSTVNAPQFGAKHFILFADGSVRRFPEGLNPSDAAAILTRNGGERVIALVEPYSWFAYRRNPVEILWGAVLLVAIALLPLSRRLAIFPTQPA